jgi:iron complex outermembrane receptor protein
MIVSKTWEGGARGKLSQDAGWDFAVYDTKNQNDIQFIANGANAGVTGFFQNVGETDRRGLEFGVHGRFSSLRLAANYGFVNAIYQSSFIEASPQNSTADANGNITVNKGNRIPGIARQTFKVRADYDVTPAWNIGSTIVATSGQFAHGDENNQDANGMLGGYAVVNLDTHYRIASGLHIFAKIANLFDRSNYHTFGILAQNMFTAQNELAVVPSQPRGIWIGLTYEFGTKGSGSSDLD